MLLICLNKTSETREALTQSNRFAVNILAESQADIAYAFAKKSPDKFAQAHVDRGPNGMPLIPGSLARLECVVTETAVGGTHTVFLGEVLHAEGTDDPPLTYYRGRFGRFADMVEELAYQQLRDLVISRELSHGQRLDIEALGAQLDVAPEPLLVAISRLTADGLLQQDADGAVRVRPLDVATVEEGIDARCALEIAVVDKVAGHLHDVDAAHLMTLAASAREAAEASPADLSGLLRAVQDFHVHFIGLLGNDALSGFFSRLGYRPIWSREIPDPQRYGRTTAGYLADLVDACARGDADRARRTLYAHAEAVKVDARAAIEQGGGEL